jgi:hypothetical protein
MGCHATVSILLLKGNQMKYLIIFLLLIVNAAVASEVKIVSYGPKTGATVALGILVSKQLAANPTVLATGDCQEASRQFDSERNVIAIIGSPSMIKGQLVGKKCPIPFDHKVMFAVTSYYSVCHMKDHNGQMTGSSSRITMPSVFPGKKFISEFNQDNEANLRMINISGGGEALASLLSGDVEFTLMPHYSAAQSVTDGKIICRSLDPKDPTYLGKDYKIRNEPFYGLIYIITKGLGTEQNNELAKILRSVEVQNYLSANSYLYPVFEPNRKELEEINKIFVYHTQLYLQ